MEQLNLLSLLQHNLTQEAQRRSDSDDDEVDGSSTEDEDDEEDDKGRGSGPWMEILQAMNGGGM